MHLFWKTVNYWFVFIRIHKNKNHYIIVWMCTIYAYYPYKQATAASNCLHVGYFVITWWETREKWILRRMLFLFSTYRSIGLENYKKVNNMHCKVILQVFLCMYLLVMFADASVIIYFTTFIEVNTGI